MLAAAQAPPFLNLDMEQVSSQTHRPTGWQTSIRTGAPADFRKAYELVADSLTRHGGRYAR
jgi:hypothetical protein